MMSCKQFYFFTDHSLIVLKPLLVDKIEEFIYFFCKK